MSVTVGIKQCQSLQINYLPMKQIRAAHTRLYHVVRFGCHREKVISHCLRACVLLCCSAGSAVAGQAGCLRAQIAISIISPDAEELMSSARSFCFRLKTS